MKENLLVYNFNDLEKMLRDGVSADEIAQAFTKNLNNAIDAVKPTPMEIAGEDLAKAWNRMVDLYLEDNDAPSFIDDTDDLYVSGETATRLFTDSMELLHKVAPLWDLIAELGSMEDDELIEEPKRYKCNKKAPVETNTAGDEVDEFEKTMKKFLKSIGV